MSSSTEMKTETKLQAQEGVLRPRMKFHLTKCTHFDLDEPRQPRPTNSLEDEDLGIVFDRSGQHKGDDEAEDSESSCSSTSGYSSSDDSNSIFSGATDDDEDEEDDSDNDNLHQIESMLSTRSISFDATQLTSFQGTRTVSFAEVLVTETHILPEQKHEDWHLFYYSCHELQKQKDALDSELKDAIIATTSTTAATAAATTVAEEDDFTL